MARVRRRLESTLSAAPGLEARIDSLGHDGRGVARIDGKVAFIDGALPGELVRWHREVRHRQYDEGVAVEILEASPDRVTPRCEHFGRCGGCRLQHLEPSKQLEFKQAELAAQLERIGRVVPESWLPPLTGDPWHYRRRARLSARHVVKLGRAMVGFRERASTHVTDVTTCPVLSPPLSASVGRIAAAVTDLSIRERMPQVEVAIGDQRTVLVFRTVVDPTPADRERLLALGRELDADVWLQPKGPDTAAPLAGTGKLSYALPEFDVEITFEPTDFVQVNGDLNRRMVSAAVERLQLDPSHVVLDLFAGLGNFTLPIARRAGRVIAVEGEAGLVARARANAVANGCDNVTCHVANLFEPGNAPAWLPPRVDRVLLDPPRAGAREVLPLIASRAPGRIVYVSCHPGSLARDAGLLVTEHGYRLVAAGVMDMFPHTAHVESMAVFERR